MNAWIADRQVLALSLQATVLSHARVREAATAFATELANGRGCARVSVGFVRNGLVRLVAVSHGGSDADGLQQQDFAPVTAAMDEAVQQGASVYSPAQGVPAIRLAHRALLGDRGGAAASIPLVHLGQACGAITCEWTTSPLELPALVAEIENIVSLAGPVLLLMHQLEQPLRHRLADSLRLRLQRLREGHRIGLVAGLALGALALVALLAMPMDHRVGGRARVEGEQQRSLVAPLDGFLKAVHARPGDRVQAGQVLVEMADQDLALQRRRWTSELGQQENAYASAIARADRAAMVIALARADEARAQLALVDAELARTRITAPFAGIVVDGDLTQVLGAPLERGKQLMLLAPLDRYRVMVQVDERDIGHLRVGQGGKLTLAALPWDALPVQVTRITPVARAVEGRNVFEIETDLRTDVARIRPGLEGVAKIDVGRAPVAWVWLHRVAEWIRLTAWTWAP